MNTLDAFFYLRRGLLHLKQASFRMPESNLTVFEFVSGALFYCPRRNKKSSGGIPELLKSAEK